MQTESYAQHVSRSKTAQKKQKLDMVLKNHEYDDKLPTSSE
jgi:hypothetical protein